MRPSPAFQVARRTAASTLVVLVACAGGLCMGEALLRTGLDLDRVRFHYLRSRDVFQFDPTRVRFDPELGWVTRPDLAVRFRNREFDTTVRTNSLGYRDDQDSLHDPDILVLGDSFAFGWGVDQGETVADALERRSGLRALNLGVPGYGTLQEYIVLRRYAQTRDLSGTIAIFFLNATDVLENAAYPLGNGPYADWSGHGPRVHRPSSDAFDDWLLEVNRHRSRGVFAASLFADLGLQAVRALGRGMRLYTPPRPAYQPTEADHRSAFERTLDATARLQVRSGARIAFALVPSRDDLGGGRAADRVRDMLQRSGLPVIDLGPAMSEEDYFRLDDHWTAAGHAHAAATVDRTLREWGWLD